MTLAIIGASSCRRRTAWPARAGGGEPAYGAGCASGVSALAHHVEGVVTLLAIACAALAATAFVWYMFLGYKSTGQAGGNRDAAGSS